MSVRFRGGLVIWLSILGYTNTALSGYVHICIISGILFRHRNRKLKITAVLDPLSDGHQPCLRTPLTIMGSIGFSSCFFSFFSLQNLQHRLLMEPPMQCQCSGIGQEDLCLRRMPSYSYTEASIAHTMYRIDKSTKLS